MSRALIIFTLTVVGATAWLLLAPAAVMQAAQPIIAGITAFTGVVPKP